MSGSPIEVVYQRWWSVHPHGGGFKSADYADEEEAVRAAVQALKDGAVYVNIAITDRLKP